MQSLWHFIQNWSILIAEKVVYAVLEEGGKKTGSGRTRAENSDKLSDTGRARAWASWARAGLGPIF